jgi:hypothetical protein
LRSTVTPPSLGSFHSPLIPANAVIQMLRRKAGFPHSRE